MKTTSEPFNWYDVPAYARRHWWKLSRENKERLYAYYRRMWYAMQ